MHARPFRLPSALVCLALAAAPLHAQGIMGRLKDKAKQIQKKTEHAIDSTIDQKPAAKAPNGSAVVKPVADVKPADASAGSSAPDASAASAPPGQGAWLNYDFVPGDSVLYFEDFADDAVGDLPKHLDVTHGNVTVVDIGGKKYLRTVTGGDATITLPAPLPERFTIEVTFHRRGGNGMGLFLYLGRGTPQQLALRCDAEGRASIEGHGASGTKESGERNPAVGPDDFETCRYMVDGGYVKAYVNEMRVGQLNGLTIARTPTIKVDLANADQNGALVTDIRIAAGGRKLWDALSTSGRASTHGILFATGSATLRPESTPTLKEIGDLLKAHPDVRLAIEGHTDDVGDAASNQTLSEQRAAAVKTFLVSSYGVDAGRLQTRGFGASKPVAPNTTPEGRQQNRRVELVKL